MGLWLIGGFECNREEPLDDIKHSIYLRPLTSYITSQCNAFNQFMSILSANNSITVYQHLQHLQSLWREINIITNRYIIILH